MARRPKPTALARTDPHAALTEEELALVVDRIVDGTNERIVKSDQEREGAAGDLFRDAFRDDPGLVLDAAPSTRVWKALQSRAGKSLRLLPWELDDYARAAALTQRLHDNRWTNLGWSGKLALLSLTRLDDGMKSFYRGLAYATLPSTSAAALRKWVGKELPKGDGGGRPEGLSYRGRKQLTAGGLRLSDAAARARFAREFRAAPKNGRSLFLKELRAVARNLALLLEELQGGGEP